MINFAFSPASVTVNVGDTVTWTNRDNAPRHTDRALSSRTPLKNRSLKVSGAACSCVVS